jgi:hypothetical protein
MLTPRDLRIKRNLCRFVFNEKLNSSQKNVASAARQAKKFKTSFVSVALVVDSLITELKSCEIVFKMKFPVTLIVLQNDV